MLEFFSLLFKTSALRADSSNQNVEMSFSTISPLFLVSLFVLSFYNMSKTAPMCHSLLLTVNSIVLPVPNVLFRFEF